MPVLIVSVSGPENVVFSHQHLETVIGRVVGRKHYFNNRVVSHYIKTKIRRQLQKRQHIPIRQIELFHPLFG